MAEDDTGRSWGEISRRGFQVWPRGRYGDLDALNQAWGAVFWSQEYSEWEQIGLLIWQPDLLPPHLLDYQPIADS